MKHLRIVASALVIPFMFSLSAKADSVNANLTVTASVTDACLVSGGNLNFGDYDPLSGNPVNASGDFTVTCTLNTPATITLGQGDNPGAGSTDDTPVRQMSDGTNVLEYTLYTDASHTTPWGNTDTTGLGIVGTGNPETISVYGTIPGGQNVPSGNYADTVVITVTF